LIVTFIINILQLDVKISSLIIFKSLKTNNVALDHDWTLNLIFEISLKAEVRSYSNNQN
jgi:hypothetical protein